MHNELLNTSAIETLDSREVAEMIDIRHDNLIKKIRSYQQILDSSKLRSQEFFIPSTYLNSQNKEQPCYLLTKKGCEMVANKLTGEKGVLFTAQYVNRFEEMEKKITQPQLPSSPMEVLKLTFDALTQTNENVSNHEYRIKELEDNKLLNPGEYNYISKAVKNKVKSVMSELDMNLVGKQKSQIYHAINRDLNCFIGIKTRSQFKAKDFDKALEFIQNWQLSYTDKKIIEQLKFDL